MIEFFAVVGVLATWAGVGYVLELALARHLPRKPRPRPWLAWLEVALVYGPVGLAVHAWCTLRP